MFCFRLSFFPRGGGPGDRAGQPGRVGVGPGNRAGWIASGRAGQPSLQLAVRTGEPTCGSTGTPTGGSTVPTAEAKFDPSTGPSTAPPTDAKSGPSTAPSTDAPDSHANAPQPKSLTMQRDSGRTASAILKNLCEVTHFLYVKQNSPQLDCNLNSKCQPETTRTHRPDFEHQVYARETAKSLGILQSPIYGRS